MESQRRWQRITLLAVLAFEALGALVGGGLLVAAPDGHSMDMPVTIMHGVFPDFLIPGIILFALGLLGAAAFVAVLRRSRAAWIAAGLALGGFAVWFFVEIAILRELHWLHAVWGLPVLVGGAVAVPLLPFRATTLRTVGLVCGVASSLLYLAMNIVAPLQWRAYHSLSQTVSELSAIGAPTRPLWVVMGLVYTLLVVAFGCGVLTAAADNRRLRVAGHLIIIYGALGVVWPFAPMHLREALAAGQGSFSDTLHIGLGAATEIVYLLALAFAAAALGRIFRLYSIATFALLLVFAVLTFREAPRIGANEPTPLIGVWERINIGVFLVWMIVLAIALLWRPRPTRRAAPYAVAQPA